MKYLSSCSLCIVIWQLCCRYIFAGFASSMTGTLENGKLQYYCSVILMVIALLFVCFINAFRLILVNY